VDNGVPMQDALPPLTSNVSELLKLSGKGRLRIGGDADLVVLGNNCEVRDVMARGRWHVLKGEAVVTGTYENG